MATKLGAHVSIVTRLGRDVFGENMLENFRSLGIDTTHVGVDGTASSGVAPIAVDANGDNSIVIVTGANDRLTPDDVERARPAIAAADVLLCQLEIPLEVTLAALAVAREESTLAVLNPAPAVSDLPAEAYEYADLLCPNESETAVLLGHEVAIGNELAAARELRARGVGTVVVTLGARGCVVATVGEELLVPPEAVDVLDTTGAGDAFVGSLACFLACGEPPALAAARANRIAAISVGRPGTQTSFPAAHELPRELVPGGT